MRSSEIYRMWQKTETYYLSTLLHVEQARGLNLIHGFFPSFIEFLKFQNLLFQIEKDPRLIENLYWNLSTFFPSSPQIIMVLWKLWTIKHKVFRIKCLPSSYLMFFAFQRNAYYLGWPGFCWWNAGLRIIGWEKTFLKFRIFGIFLWKRSGNVELKFCQEI